jgi:Clostridium P-47 protein
MTDLSPGVRAWCRTQSFLGMHLVNRPDGAQTLGFFDNRPAVTNHWVEQDPAIAITEEILGVVALIAALVATVVTAGAAIGALALVIGLAAGTLALSTTVISDMDQKDAPAINAMVLDCTAPIVWADTKDFPLGSAALSDSLQLGGTLKV